MPFAPLQISSLIIQPNLMLAPMSGITGSAFRRLVKRENPACVGLVFSEFISVEGLTRGSKRSAQMYMHQPEEKPISIQLFGYDISRTVEAALIAQEGGADAVDINCGCPVPKVVKRGGGCELMRQPEHLAKILQALKKELKVPLTIKIRAGWEDSRKNALEIGRMAQDCGAAAVTLHARTRAQGYQGQVDWTLLEGLCSALSIPVIASGDIVDTQTAARAWRAGARGLMIGRRALSNPWVFSEIAAASGGGTFNIPGEEATIRVIQDYLLLLAEELPQKAILGRAKQFILHVTKRIAGSSGVRKSLCLAKTEEEFLSVLASWSCNLIEKGRLLA